MFFHTQLLISTLLAVSCVLGAPNVKRQGAGPACGSLGTGAYSTRGRIQVAAFNPNGSNDHEYGAELFLGGAGPTDPWHSTFTVGGWDTSRGWAGFHMTNSGLTQSGTSTASVGVPDGDVPTFISTTPTPAPAEVWCGVPSNEVTGEHKWDYLAANGRHDLWSLCEKKYSWDTVRRIAYNVDKTKSNELFDVDTCVPVYLTIVPY